MLALAGKTKGHSLRIEDCGLADYRQVLLQQHELRDKRRRGEIPDTILITEHSPVITLGARQSANKLQVSRDSLMQQPIDVVDIRRGGGTTAHNPGQLVVYPILHLQELSLGISEYIRELETIGAKLLEELGIRSQQRKGFRGLWIDNRKVASIGVRVSKFVTYHGMAINIQNDLSIFDYITPCGLDGVEMTSVLKETGKSFSMSQVKDKLTQLLRKHFSISNEQEITNSESRKLPPWLRRPLPAGESYNRTNKILNSLGLQTICSNANCPNRGECWSRGTATVLILGNICTRSCKFCSVATGKPAPPDTTEPERIAEMAKQLGLKYLVITSVDRDDLPDGGAGHFRDCINEVKRRCREMRFEILTPDFRNCQGRAIEILRDALPFVFAHNIETVPSLYPVARSGGDYQLSLSLIRMAKESYDGIQIKSSIMLGLGETEAEVEQVLKDLRNVGCDRVTIGQYLKPSKKSLEVVEYVRPEKFDFWKQRAIEMGFSYCLSSPFARSSYFAEQEQTS
ncbi:MAG: lipoyl synthase [Planctomycetota bacterium]|jgi:lipoic acid synthetase